jgi:23S rRNA pseudouridine2604 synthase
MRINKFLSACGVCSRREADRHIASGEVLLNGRVAQMGDQVGDTDEVQFRGEVVKRDGPFVLLAYYKPVGLVCSAKERDNIVDAIGYPERIYPIGRLDKDSEGLVLLTNQGELHNLISHARGFHEKEYEVRVNQTVTCEFLDAMRSGVAILDTVTRPCEVRKTSRDTFTIILTQGLNRQIRRMCEALGYRVVSLKRTRVMNITLAGLNVGEYRAIEGKERDTLMKMLKKN